jgi:hypothetical protein
MTRKDYNLIARVIRLQHMTDVDRQKLTDAFVLALSVTNHRFDAHKFVNACDPNIDRETL